MRMISSGRFSRTEGYAPMMVSACLQSGIEDYEPMHTVSAYRLSRIEDSETARMVLTYCTYLEDPSVLRTRPGEREQIGSS